MQDRRSVRRAAAVALVLLVLTGAAGCSDDESTSGATSTTAADGSVDERGETEGPDDSGPDASIPDGETPSDDTDEAPDGPGDDSSSPGTTVPPFGELPAINAGAPVRVLSCEPDDAGHLVATVELDNITDLPLDAKIEVLFEDADAVELERAQGTIAVIQPGASGTGTVTSEGAVAIEGATCLLIGMARTEYLPDELPDS